MTTSPSATANPFDDIRALMAKMPEADEAIHDSVMAATQVLGRSLHPVGKLDETLAWLASWQGAAMPSVARPLISVFAGTHGVASEVFDGDVIAYSKARVASLTEGRSAVRGIAANSGAAFKVYEFGIEHPSNNFTQGPSLSERDCAAAIAFGMEVVAEGADVIVLGNAGIGAATAAAAIALGLYGGGEEYWAGGHGEDATRRINAVEAGAQEHKGHMSDPLEILRIFGGRDIAGIVGAILAARHQRIPVILDGYVVCAAAAILHKINPASIDHCMAAHVSQEPAHQALLDRMTMKPMLDLELNIGDGTGGAMAMTMLKAAAAGLLTLQDGVI
ncbi:nicotinate-nucleotide--dimethylbenzimidazole phosphoribosyltransferase [Litorimonas sp. RW-G-Af-16]|uniref:nicotinate-nucleotide--dimethylbenzimidazole phosphoribosyltransferase n=1 Tax=Litorimonas sp. RW-G-Af-16 TaxID=3241168 RepID=UPI00390C6D22